MDTDFLRKTEDGVTLQIKVTPGAKKENIGEIIEMSDGKYCLTIKVAAPPEKGKANASVVKLLCKKLGLRKSAVSIIAGTQSRLKVFHVSGDPEALYSSVTSIVRADV